MPLQRVRLTHLRLSEREKIGYSLKIFNEFEKKGPVALICDGSLYVLKTIDLKNNFDTYNINSQICIPKRNKKTIILDIILFFLNE